MKLLKWTSCALVALSMADLGFGDDKGIPWDMGRLSRPPKVFPAESLAPGEIGRGLTPLFFQGEPYQGRETRVFAWYGVPSTGKGPHPAMVLVHGGGGTAYADWVRLWNDRGYAAIAVDTTGCIPVVATERGKVQPNGKKHDYGGPDRRPVFGNVGLDIHDQWSYHAVADVILAHSLMRGFPEVDPDRIGVTGISWGGYLASIVAGVDHRFKCAVPVYGCGFYAECCWASELAKLGEPGQKWLRLWDPSQYLGNARAPMLWVSGSNEDVYYLPALKKSYLLPRSAPTLCIRVRMGHSHVRGWAPEEIYRFVGSVLRQEAPLVRITAQGRDAARAWVTYSDSHSPVKAVEFNYTTDSGNWSKRSWQKQSVQFDPQSRKVEAVVPTQATAYYFNLMDERNHVVSSQHEEHQGQVNDALRQEARRKARHFLDREKQFQIGALPIEQSHPKTVGLAETAQREPEAAIRMLQAVDRDLGPVATQAFAAPEFRRLVAAMRRAVDSGGRICFSGCGSPGRLSIIVEAAWRQFCQEFRQRHPAIASRLPDLEDRVTSIMTGGDFALVRSVENFEDHGVFARRQVQELRLGKGDVLVGLSAPGETSSVIGSVWQAVDNGAEVFFVFNSPTEVVARHVERSRQVIEDPRIVKISLDCGSMAVLGSTRMQATTSQMLVAGAALEMTLIETLRTVLAPADFDRLHLTVRQPAHYASLFLQLVDDLRQPPAVAAISAMVQYEERIYRRKGLVTYMAESCLLDICGDTTERSPTFMLPPFRKCDDQVSPPPWAFVKNPRLPSAEAWRQLLRREPRCLEWDTKVYRELGAPAELQLRPPQIGAVEMLKFHIGNEDDASRYAASDSAAILIALGEEVPRLRIPGDPLREAFAACARPFPQRAALLIGPEPAPADVATTVWHVPVRLPVSPLRLWDHMAAKLVLNTMSTVTGARMGRLVGNTMAHVNPSNKKLLDRGTRIVAELGGVDYETACYALFETMEELAHTVKPGEERPSPVATAIARLKHAPKMKKELRQ